MDITIRRRFARPVHARSYRAYRIANRNRLYTSRLAGLSVITSRRVPGAVANGKIQRVAGAARILDAAHIRRAIAAPGPPEPRDPRASITLIAIMARFLCACRQGSQLPPLDDTAGPLIAREAPARAHGVTQANRARGDEEHHRSRMRRCAKIRAWNFSVSTRRGRR